MDSNWNTRLKNARENSGYTLRQISSMPELNISQQSMIKYEKGEVFPRIDFLDKLCKKYKVTLNYIVYGDSELFKTCDFSSQFVTIFMLLYSNKLKYHSKDKSLKIEDASLNKAIFTLNAYIEQENISTIDDLSRLIKAIEMLSNNK